ncbi:hypothetical protein BGZ81_007866 [Podila clonocystis]|nr:hypothetical protein BGZ81_007866 [Podila clonocystis]
MKRLNAFLVAASQRQDIVLVAIMMAAVFMMILPLPTVLVDMLIALNIMLSIMILTIAIYMSIDGDMRANAITVEEAKVMRELLQKESRLYGAMDGAMKFVKGDAIASMIVVLVNIVGGIAIGMLQRNMSVGDALTTYAVLSVGDGLIAQIPALLISITAGLIVTRIPGEATQNLAEQMVEEISRQPWVLLISGLKLTAAKSVQQNKH